MRRVPANFRAYLTSSKFGQLKNNIIFVAGFFKAEIVNCKIFNCVVRKQRKKGGKRL